MLALQIEQIWLSHNQPSTAAAMLINLNIILCHCRPDDDLRVLPVHYSHNYLILAPGEKLKVAISYCSQEPTVPIAQGWNTERLLVNLS